MKTILSNITEILILLMLLITLLQSGWDKVSDWSGNLSWLKGHFAESPFKNMVPALLGTLLVFELVSGLLCLLGIYQLAFNDDGSLALYGAIFSAITLLMLLFGQRIAKDYEGARTIVVYFIPTVFLVFLLSV
ncbi:DoxX family protein [Robiginitalea sp. IMCC43444]|uniref:DoxX family protein n=1 Tax=Robiginitalea sp. IMCC43444 TaxID=3459121 RepID=UPI004041AF54